MYALALRHLHDYVVGLVGARSTLCLQSRMGDCGESGVLEFNQTNCFFHITAAHWAHHGIFSARFFSHAIVQAPREVQGVHILLYNEPEYFFCERAKVIMRRGYPSLYKRILPVGHCCIALGSPGCKQHLLVIRNESSSALHTNKVHVVCPFAA